MPHHPSLCTIAIAAALYSSSAAANFVDDWLDARGYCTVVGPGTPYQAYGVGVDPFGKPASDWTTDDLEHLTSAFERCQRIASERGAHHDFLDFAGLKRLLPQMIQKAKAEVAAKSSNDAAAVRMRALEQRQKAATAERERSTAEAERQVAEAERADAQKDTEATIARDEARIAAAHARRDAALARQKSAAIEAEAKAAETEAAGAEQSKPTISAKPSAAAVAPAADPSSTDYTAVSVLDLQLDGKSMIGEKVVVRGFVMVFSDQGASIFNHEDDVNGIELHLDNGDPETRKYIISHCGRLSRTCRMAVKATVREGDSEKPELDLD